MIPNPIYMDKTRIRHYYYEALEGMAYPKRKEHWDSSDVEYLIKDLLLNEPLSPNEWLHLVVLAEIMYELTEHNNTQLLQNKIPPGTGYPPTHAPDQKTLTLRNRGTTWDKN